MNEKSYAYAVGYFHGRMTGIDKNPYCGETEAEQRYAYTEGYERGVNDYCEEEEQ